MDIKTNKQRLQIAEKCKNRQSYVNTGNTVTVQAEQEHREIKNAAPFGIISVPPVGAKAVVTPTEQGFIYTGVIGQNAELEPGELMLYSSGGANIVLKNDGQVLINGTSIE